MNCMRTALRYLNLWGSLAKFSLLAEMAFRGNFLVKVFVELLWLAILLLFNFTLFEHTRDIAEWNQHQYLFFLGCYFAMGGLLETLFLSNCNEFAELVRTGDLDFFLLRPSMNSSWLAAAMLIGRVRRTCCSAAA